MSEDERIMPTSDFRPLKAVAILEEKEAKEARPEAIPIAIEPYTWACLSIYGSEPINTNISVNISK